MTLPASDWTRKLHELRTSFDEAFELPPRAQSRDEETLLAIESGGTPLALRTAELLRLEARRKVVPVPAACADLLGLAGVRGKLVPVYSLASLLGLRAGGEERWLVLCGGDQSGAASADSIALAFAALSGHAQVSRGEIFAVNEDARPIVHASELVRLGGVTRALVSIPSVTRAIRDRQRAARAGRGEGDIPTGQMKAATAASSSKERAR